VKAVKMIVKVGLAIAIVIVLMPTIQSVDWDYYKSESSGYLEDIKTEVMKGR